MDYKIVLFLFTILFYFLLMLRSMKLALLAYLFLCPFNIFLPLGAKNINSTEAVAMMFIVVWLAGLLRKEKLLIPNTVFTIPLFVYFATSFILIVNTGLTVDVVTDIIRHFQFFAVFIIFVSYFKEKKDIYAISNILIASLAVLCLVAIVEIVFVYGVSGVAWQRSILWKKGLIDIGLYPATELSLNRLASWSARAGLVAIFPIQHAFGVYLSSLIYLLVWRIFIHRELNMKKIGMFVLFIISFFILIFTKSRTAIFAFLLSIPILVIFLGNWRLRLKIISLIGLLLIAIMVFMPNVIIEQSTDWIETLHKSGFAGLGKGDIARIDYFLGSVNAFLKNPFVGTGYDISIIGVEPHGAITQALVFKGLLGGITLIWILFRMFKASYKYLRKIKQIRAEPAHFLSAEWLLSLTIYLCVASLGVGIFGYVLPSIPAISAMSMFVITRKSFAIEKGSEPLESFKDRQNRR
jgi:O-antigen ligase